MYAATATSPAEDPKSEVGGQVESLHLCAKLLGESVAILENRLSSVLSQGKESGETAQSAPEPVRVPLAQVLHDAVLALDRINEQVKSVTRRVEL